MLPRKTVSIVDVSFCLRNEQQKPGECEAGQQRVQIAGRPIGGQPVTIEKKQPRANRREREPVQLPHRFAQIADTEKGDEDWRGVLDENCIGGRGLAVGDNEKALCAGECDGAAKLRQ